MPRIPNLDHNGFRLRGRENIRIEKFASPLLRRRLRRWPAARDAAS